MYSFKNIILFSFAALILCWILMSLHPSLESYTVVGKVEALNGNVAKAKIKYSQDPEDTNFRNMPEIDVQANGHFSQVLNINANGSVYFYVIKKGYTVSKLAQTLRNKEEENNIGIISISSLHKNLSYKQLNNKEEAPHLALYTDQCLQRLDDKINITNILYFENLTNVEKPFCIHGEQNVLLSAKLNFNGKVGNHIYFELEKQADGTALILEPKTLDTPVDGSMLATKVRH